MTHLPRANEYRTIAFDTERHGAAISFYWGYEPNFLDSEAGGTIRIYEIHSLFLSGGLQSSAVTELEAMHELKRLEAEAMKNFNVSEKAESVHYKGTKHYKQNPRYAQQQSMTRLEKLRSAHNSAKFKL